MALARKLTAKIYEIKAHNDSVCSLDLGETGRVLVTGGKDRNVNLWAIGQEECFMSLTGHNRPIDCVRFAYNDDFVYSADDIGIIRRWDLNAQQICSTLNGHMKSVRTLDFNPSGEYIVSGSNDTTVRLWDVRNQNRCIKVYRGHISYVNSVKFSPDGLWIASAGTEGTIIIWDIRKSKQIMDFAEQPAAAAITCIQFHPFEFLLAVGRVDGTVSIYDLESQMRISRTDATSQFYGHPIKCITFSENGECLFVGTSAGITVIGWEPDREYDHIKAAWTALGDMKVINRKLFCGSFDKEFVSINALSIDRVFPFYNPSNMQPPAFSHNTTTRKSFSRGNQKLRLSLTAGPKPTRLLEEDGEDNKSPSLDGQSSPNLSLEMVDESGVEFPQYPPLTHSPPPPAAPAHQNGYGKPFSNFPGTNGGYPSFGGSSLYNTTASLHFDGPSSLKVKGERDIYQYEHRGGVGASPLYGHDMEYNLNDSNPPVISNYEHTEMVEDFPVNQGTTAGPPTGHTTTTTPSGGPTVTHTAYGGGSVTITSTKTAKPKTTSHIQKRTSQIALSASGAKTLGGTSSFQSRHKFAQVSSVSTTELHKLDDNMLLKKSASSHLVVNKGPNGRVMRSDSHGHSQHGSNATLNKENARNKNITVQIITKPPPPTRSRTSHDLRSPQRQTNRLSTYTADTTTNIPVGYRPDPSLLSQSSHNQRQLNRSASIDDSSEIHMLSVSHEQVYQELSNRHATLQLIRNSTRSHDIVGALRQAIKISGRTVFVDLLGAILEKTSSWNLDLCLLLLPEIYELLQSQHKFHYTRACDTLRVILSNFLPIIQENIDPWAASGLGVDVSREERQRKCIECQRWLLQIRNIPETQQQIGNTLTQLQNLIVNI